MTRSFAFAMGVVVTALAATPSQASWATPDDELPNVDRRVAERAPLSASTRAARKSLESDLGPLGDVRTDAKSGGVAYLGRPDGLLTGPSPASPASVVLEYVRAHGEVFELAEADLANLQLVARSVSPDGITHLRFNQVLDGILAFDSGIDGHVTADGRLVNVSGAAVAGARLRDVSPQLSAGAGLGEARRAVEGSGVAPRTSDFASGPDRTTTFSTGERAALRWAATADGPRLVWNVLAEDVDGHAYDVLVDAESTEILRRQDLTLQLGEARYFPADPLRTPTQAQITMPPEWYDEHTGGTRLWGQFARTYADPDDQDPLPGSELGGTRLQIPASAGAPDSPDWLHPQPTTFPDATPCPASGCTWDSATPMSATTNQFQVGTNVHVVASRFHDHLEQAPIGFDEASGNFQRTNTPGQGEGGDYVRAEVNDGQGLNNANFFTPPDGEAPRMQMFLFTSRDVNGGDVAEIVYHEYAHGLSNRLVVNASGASTLSSVQPRMMGEAWSDFYGHDLLVHEGSVVDTPAPGELTAGSYVSGPAGVRAKPADCPVNPAGTVAACNGSFGAVVLGGYTYGDLIWSDGLHNGGEVWSQTLWDIRTAVGRDAALALVTGGMRLSIDNPSMLDMRDAILQQAIATRSALGAPDDHYVTLWKVFASRGMGTNASTPSANVINPTEGFEVPPLVQAGSPVLSDPYPGGDEDGAIEPGERFDVAQPVTWIGNGDLADVTGTLSSSDPAVAIEDATAAWPLLGPGREASNADPLAGRIPTGDCTTRRPITIDVASSEGSAQVTAMVDPRPASGAVVPLADKTGAGAPDAVTAATFEATGSGAVTDVDLRIDDLRHSSLGDLRVELIHDGQTAVVFDRLGGGTYAGDDVVEAIFDSDGGGALPTTGAGPITGRLRPQAANALGVFDGRPIAGTWTLRVTDTRPSNGGELRRWGLDSPQIGCGQLEIPVAQTSAASDLEHDGATLNGSVTPNGRATGLRFAYGTTSSYGSSTRVEDVGAGSAAVPATAALAGLAPDTTYHYRVEAIRKGELAVAGEDRSFRTPSTPVQFDLAPILGSPIAPPSLPTRATGDTVRPRFTSKPRVTLAKVAKRRSRRRASFAFALSEPARVTVTVTRAAPGVRRGKRCVAVRGPRPEGMRCTRQISAAKRTTSLSRAGKGQLRLAARGLGKGRYRATLVAIDAAGNRSAKAVVRFAVR